MDEIRLSLLRAGLQRQRERIDDVYELLRERARELACDAPAFGRYWAI
jgi:hypothetical protein